MKTISLNYPIDPQQMSRSGIVLALGFFDGVHIGHQAVIQQAKQVAQQLELPLAVMTFQRHPALVISPTHPQSIHYLTTNGQKEDLLKDLGVDCLYQLNFTSQVAQLTPSDFVDHFLMGLHAKAVVAGFDYSYGRGGQGTMAELDRLARGRFEVYCVDEYRDDHGHEVCSTLIRQLIQEGKVKQAAYLLGRPYELNGYVIHGQARGRELGFPTANLYPHADLLIPKIGVYASQTYVQGQWHGSMTSVGYNPTFNGPKEITIESHLFDFDRAIYGEDIRIQWVDYLRDEQAFADRQALFQQMQEDERISRQILRDV